MAVCEPLVVVGAGGFGREVLDLVDAVNDAAGKPVWNVIGVLDDGPTEANLRRLSMRGVEFLGGVNDHLAPGRVGAYVVGIGAPTTRRMIVEKFERVGWSAATLIHPAATLGFGATVGDGSVICAGARVATNVRMGRHVHLNPNVTVGHDTSLGDFVSMNPASSVSGDCDIEQDVLIGVAGVVLNKIWVGRGATIGASACVVRDVPTGMTVKGVPAR